MIETNNIVLAIGHSARDTFLMLQNRNIAMERKSFSVGARIEHSQVINKSQYGKACKLPAADYKMAVHLESGRGVYTFCMCPGGRVLLRHTVGGQQYSCPNSMTILLAKNATCTCAHQCNANVSRTEAIRLQECIFSVN